MSNRIFFLLGILILILAGCQAPSTLEPTSTAFTPVTAGTPIPAVFEPINSDNAHLIAQLAYWEHEFFVDYVLAFSPDSQYLLIGRYGNLTSTFRVEDGALIQSQIGRFEPSLLPNDDRNNHTNDGIYQILEHPLGGFTLRNRLGQTNFIYVRDEFSALDLFPNEEYLAVALEGHNLRIIPTDIFLPRLQAIKSQTSFSEDNLSKTGVSFQTEKLITNLIVSPDNNSILIVLEDKTVQLIDISTLSIKNEFKLEDIPIARKFLPGSTIIAFGFPDQSIELWDVNSGRKLSALEDHTGRIRDLAFSPDGRFLASLNNESNVFLWGILPAKVSEHAVLTSTAVANFSPTATDKPNDVVDPSATPEPSHRDEVLEIYNTLNSIPEGEYLLVFSAPCYSMQLVSLEGQIYNLTNDRFASVLPGGERLLIEFPDPELPSLTAFLLDLSNGDIFEYPIENLIYDYRGFSPDGNMMASYWGRLKIYDLPSGTSFDWLSWAYSYESFTTSAWSPDGQYLAYSRQQTRAMDTEPEDGVYLTNTRCFEEVTTCKNDTVGPIFSGVRTSPSSLLAWSHDSQWLALASLSGRPIRIYNRETGVEKALSDVHLSNGLAWSPDGQYLAVGLTGIEIVNIETESISTLLEGSYWVESWLTIDRD